MVKQSQSEFSNDGPAGIYHRFQCSAGKEGISGKVLIMYGEGVERGLAPVPMTEPRQARKESLDISGL